MRSKNILLVVGTTVGAGIFSLPFAFRQIGVIPFLLLILLLAYVTLRLNIYFAEVTHSVKTKHQLPGYVGIVLGKNLGKFALILQLVSAYGALIAFASIGGQFLAHSIGIQENLGMMVFFIAACAILFFSGKGMERLDELFAAGKGILFGLLIVFAFLFFPASTYHIPPMFGSTPHLAYGLILFSLTGFSIIPEMHPEKGYKKSLWMAQIVIVVLYLILTLALSPYAMVDTFVFKNQMLGVFVNVTGFISVFTTYLLMSLITKDIFVKDIKFPEKGALGLVTIVPFLAIFFHFDGFMKVLSLTGGVFLGAVGLLISWMYQTLYPDRNVIERILIQLLLLGGIAFELIWH